MCDECYGNNTIWYTEILYWHKINEHEKLLTHDFIYMGLFQETGLPHQQPLYISNSKRLQLSDSETESEGSTVDVPIIRTEPVTTSDGEFYNY